MAIAPIYIDAPSVEQPKYGLLDTVGPKAGPDKIGFGVQYQSEFCGTAHPYDKPCLPEDPPTEKDADDGITTVIGEPIPVYHLFQCRLVGSEDGTVRARRSLDLGASRAVEEAFWVEIGTGSTDITPGGTAVNLLDGLALAEQYAGENYGGVPVFHMSRANASRLLTREALVVVGDHLETKLGSLVVAGAGYGGGSLPSAPAVGAGWIYVTGQVNVWEGDTFVSPVVPRNPYDNEFLALAERLYVPTYECFHAAIEVTETIS